MGHEFTRHDELTVAATPEQVWSAIATGGGIDSWYVGRSDVDEGVGGAVRTAFGDYAPTMEITGWEPPHRLAYGTPEAPDGRRIAHEFLVEGRAGGSTVVRIVTSGFIPGDDWADEFEAMGLGLATFYRTLAEYLNHLAGRAATPLTVFGPPVRDWDRTWANVRRALDRPPLAPGVVYVSTAQTLGVRTPDALYRFLRGFHGPLIASHHLFSDVDAPAEERAWRTWLEEATS
jgi:uncharacterized protein YndB with AHSA1/START domain